MGWQERLRQMVLAGGVFVAGCGGEKLGASGTGGSNATGDTVETGGAGGTLNTGGAGGTLNTGGAGGALNTGGAGGALNTGGAGGAGGIPGAGGTPGTGGVNFCGNANPDPCICGRPEASAAAAELCAQSTACKAVGGELFPNGSGASPICERDGAVVELSDAAARD